MTLHEEIEKMMNEAKDEALKEARKKYSHIIDAAFQECEDGQVNKANILWRCYRDLCMDAANGLDSR